MKDQYAYVKLVSYESKPVNESADTDESVTYSNLQPVESDNQPRLASVGRLKVLGLIIFFLAIAVTAYQFTITRSVPSRFKETITRPTSHQPAILPFFDHFASSGRGTRDQSRTRRSSSDTSIFSEQLAFGPFDEPNATEYLNVLAALRAHLGEVYANEGESSDPDNSQYVRFSKLPWSEQLRATLLWAVNLHVPGKHARTAYFEQLHGDKYAQNVTLSRDAHAIVFRPPEIHEYLVGPMQEPKQIQLLRRLPYHKRPLGAIEYGALLDFLAIHCAQMDAILQEAFEASYFMPEPSPLWTWDARDNVSQHTAAGTSRCRPQFDRPHQLGRPHCLIPTFTSPLVTHDAPGRRRTWLRLMHQVVAFVQHPVDIQFNIDHTSIDPNEWTLEQIWFQGHFYRSVAELVQARLSGRLRIRHRPFTPLYQADLYQSASPTPLNSDTLVTGNAGPPTKSPIGWSWRKAATAAMQRSKRTAQREAESESKNSSSFEQNQLSIQYRRVRYGRWDFYFTVRRDTGLRVYGVYFDGTSLIAEAGLDETATVYWGWSPFMRHMTSLESMFGVGGMSAELAAGVDCPASAIYFPIQLVPSGDVGPVQLQRGVCLFESTVDPVGGPVRRHFEFSTQKQTDSTAHTNFAFGVPGSALVLRSISSLFNYDYLFDVVFHQSGVIEFAVSPTGYVHVDAMHTTPDRMKLPNSRWSSEPNTFGFLSNTDQLSFVIHHHLFHYKVDADVVGPNSVFDVVHVHGPLTSANDARGQQQCPGRSDPRLPPGLWMTQSRVRTESEARFDTKFEKPVQYLICEAESDERHAAHRSKRCLSVVNKAAIKTLLSDDHTESFAWTRHQLSVTRQHDDEPYASSIFNGVDLTEPTVNFTKFSENDESLENADLVLWVTMGNYHLPRHEDLPNTVTSGGKLAFYLMPHNLYRYSPDAYQCDQFYTANLQEWISGYQRNPSCPIKPLPML